MAASRFGPIVRKNQQSPSGEPTSTLRRTVAIARTVYPDRTWKGAADRLLFVLRSVACYPHAAQWYALLDGPIMAPAARGNPSLYKKVIRPYLTPGYTNAQKLECLREHYGFLASTLTRGAFLDVCSSVGLPLLRIVTQDGDTLDVRCLSDGKYRKEGEHSFVLSSERHGVPVSTLTFVVRRRTGVGRELVVGGTQGLPRGADKEIVKAVTKSLHGLRPKSLLVFVAQQLASAWQLDRILAVGEQGHVSRHLDYLLNRARRPSLAYNQFWLDHGGVPDAHGFFALAVRPELRDPQTIKTNKRAMYARRYAMLADLARTLEVVTSRVILPDARPWPHQPRPARPPEVRSR